MGMYTKFNVIVPLKDDTPTNIKNVVVDLIENSGMGLDDGTLEKPNHPFFKSGCRLFFANSDSYYFTGTHNSQIKYAKTFNEDNPYKMVLHIDCDFKNYNDEIDKFLDWIKEYIEDDAGILFLGYSRYEESDTPTLYYLTKNKIVAHKDDNSELA